MKLHTVRTNVDRGIGARHAHRLYNVLFPIWLLWLFPQTWVFILPGNLIIDMLVLILALTVLRCPMKKAVLHRAWWRVWLNGFLADTAGVFWMMAGMFSTVSGGGWWEENITPIMGSPFRTLLALSWTLIGVAVAGVCIYLLDRRTLGRCPELNARQAHAAALALAVITAPWLFLLPMY